MVREGGEQIKSDAVPSKGGTLAGTTAGSVALTEINMGGVKITILYFSGYENDTTTDQTMSFPLAYTNAPTVVIGGSTLPAVSASASTITITAPDSTTAYSGTCLMIGV
jgi:hypothetical protein